MNKVHWNNWQKKFYRSKEWQTLREMCINRDLNTCQRCGKLILKKGDCEVDHIIEISPKNCRSNDIILNINNLQVLCHNCHTHKTNIDKNAIDNGLDENRKNVNWNKRDRWY